MTKKPFSQIQDQLRVLAERNPEKRAGCQYFKDDQPSCIVGHVLADLGVSETKTEKRTYGYATYTDHTLMTSEGGVLMQSREPARCIDWRMLGVRMPTEKQKTWVQALQDHQDSGNSWGEALEKADEQ